MRRSRVSSPAYETARCIRGSARRPEVRRALFRAGMGQGAEKTISVSHTRALRASATASRNRCRAAGPRRQLPQPAGRQAPHFLPDRRRCRHRQGSDHWKPVIHQFLSWICRESTDCAEHQDSIRFVHLLGTRDRPCVPKRRDEIDSGNMARACSDNRRYPARSHQFKRLAAGQAVAGEIGFVDCEDLPQSRHRCEPVERSVRIAVAYALVQG